MANDYMAKLAADLEGSTMMREPELMPIIYRQDGGDFNAESFGGVGLGGDVDDAVGGDLGFDYDLEDAAEIVIGEKFGDEFSDGGQAGPMSPLPDATPEEQEAFYGFAPGTLGLQGVGRGGPGEFSGGPDDRASTIDALDRIFNKEGIPKEFVPYYNSLKDRGLTNEQAMATLAAVAGTPGGAASLTSGYTDGYSYGGPMGTLEDLIETGQTASLEQRAKKAREKQEKEDKENEGPFDEAGEFQQEPGLGDRFASILGLDDFSLASLNPLSNKLTPNQQAIMQSYKDQGLTVQQRSPMDYALGFMGSAMLPTELGAAKFLAEQATDTGIFALATDPATGFEYLVDNSGNLQLAAGELGDPSDMDAGGGDEPTPTITKKRKEETKSDPEDITKNVNKPGFPQQKLPRLTPFGQTELANIYGSDDPLFNKYATGIQALV